MPKVSDLTELTAGNVALADEMYVVDGGAASKKASVETILGTAALLTSFTVGGVKLVDNSGTDATHILAVKNAANAAKGVVASSFIDAASNVLMNADGLSIAEDARLRFSSTTAATGTPVSTMYATDASTGATTVSVYAKAKADNTTVSHAFQFLGFVDGSDYEGLQILKNGTAGWTIGIIGGGAYDARASTVKITTNDNRTGNISTYPVLDLTGFQVLKTSQTWAGGGTINSANHMGIKIATPGSANTFVMDSWVGVIGANGNPYYIPLCAAKPTTT